MIFPVFSTVLDLAKVRAYLPQMSEETRATVQGAIKSLLGGQTGGPIDNAAVGTLLNLFGPKSAQPCVLTPLLALGHAIPDPVENESGQRVAYYGFARTQAGHSPTLDEVKNAVTFAVVPKQFNDGRRVMFPQEAVAGAQCDFLALFHMSCCSKDAYPPLSALIGFHNNNGDFLTNWKPSPRAMEEGMSNMFLDPAGRPNVAGARQVGDGVEQSMLHQMMHAGGYGHECGSHARLKYTAPHQRHG